MTYRRFKPLFKHLPSFRLNSLWPEFPKVCFKVAFGETVKSKVEISMLGPAIQCKFTESSER